MYSLLHNYDKGYWIALTSSIEYLDEDFDIIHQGTKEECKDTLTSHSYYANLYAMGLCDYSSIY